MNDWKLDPTAHYFLPEETHCERGEVVGPWHCPWCNTCVLCGEDAEAHTLENLPIDQQMLQVGAPMLPGL